MARGGVDTPSAEVLVRQLEALGVEVVFGIPGVHNLAIFDALRRSEIRTILVRHEQTAAYAADGYARATGRLGVCVSTTGPGVANTAAAMGEARAARSPILQIATQIESRLLAGGGGRWSLHENPHQRELMQAVSAWTGTVARAEAIPTMIQKAAAEALSDRRGPAFLEIPHDLLSGSIRWRAAPPIHERRWPPEPGAIRRAARALDGAKRPVVWVGGGALDAHAAIGKLAEVLQAPVVTTYSGKGVLPPDHPLLVCYPPHQPEVTKLVEGADAIVIIGSDLDGMNTQGWRIRFPRPRVAINTVAKDARRNYACDVVVESDALEGVEALLAELKPKRGAAGERKVAAVRERAEAALGDDKASSRALRFIRRIEKAIDPGTIVVADMAIPGYWAAGYLRPSGPRRFQYPMGWGTLGFGLPAAIGAAAAGHRVLVIAGDAGLQYAPAELGTAVQEGLPITVLVVDDGGYGMLRFDARERFDAEFFADLRSPDFVALARSFGAEARATTLPALAKDLRWAAERDAPTLLALRARFEPPLTTSPRWPLRGRKEARP